MLSFNLTRPAVVMNLIAIVIMIGAFWDTRCLAVGMILTLLSGFIVDEEICSKLDFKRFMKKDGWRIILIVVWVMLLIP